MLPKYDTKMGGSSIFVYNLDPGISLLIALLCLHRFYRASFILYPTENYWIVAATRFPFARAWEGEGMPDVASRDFQGTGNGGDDLDGGG